MFSDLGLVCVSLPVSLTSVAGGAFSGCTNLGAIVWNCGIEVTESALSGIGNPNLLLYVGDYAQALRSGMRNVVADGLAGRITLTDNIGEDGTHGPSAFYVPQAFRVQNDISYTHVYTQQTPISDCGGWETLALPFDVETITHAVNGEAVPFAAYTGGGKRPFWLCRLTEEGFVDAGKIEANTPYIISMPNNPQYSPFYCLNGEITFTARGVTVPATVLHTDSRGSASFIPTFSCIAASPSIYALNVGEQRWGYAEGSLFDRDYRDVQPFEAYRTVATAGTPYLAIGDELRSETTDVIFVEVAEEGMMYNLQGIPVINPEKGIYIRNGQKIIVVK